MEELTRMSNTIPKSLKDRFNKATKKNGHKINWVLAQLIKLYINSPDSIK